jgi:hypothetical protein
MNSAPIHRDPYCVLAFEAVALRRDRGVKVRHPEDGYLDQKAAGLPDEGSAGQFR